MTEQTQAKTAEQLQAEKDAIIAQIHERVPGKVDVREANFHFKSTKEERKDPETGETKLVTLPKRPTVELMLPVPSIEGIMEIILAAQDDSLSDEDKAKAQKAFDLLQDAVADVVLGQAREIVNEDAAISQYNFPIEKLDWNFIANLPKASRRGGGIDADQWKAFGEDYALVMLKATDKPKEAIEKHVAILLGKFNAIKTQKKVISFFKDMLTVYVEASESAADYADCVNFLVNKADSLLEADEDKLLQNL